MMEPSIKKTITISVIALIVIILLAWGAVYLYRHQPGANNTTVGNDTTSSTSPRNLGEDSRLVTSEEKASVGTYLQTHINDLSPRKAKKGGTLTVTTVTIEAPQRAIVEYTDGSSRYSAAVAYTLDASGNITINSFDILEK